MLDDSPCVLHEESAQQLEVIRAIMLDGMFDDSLCSRICSRIEEGHRRGFVDRHKRSGTLVCICFCTLSTFFWYFDRHKRLLFVLFSPLTAAGSTVAPWLGRCGQTPMVHPAKEMVRPCPLHLHVISLIWSRPASLRLLAALKRWRNLHVISLVPLCSTCCGQNPGRRGRVQCHTMVRGTKEMAQPCLTYLHVVSLVPGVLTDAERDGEIDHLGAQVVLDLEAARAMSVEPRH